MSDEQDWADNPRLNAWLARQRAAFPAWAERTGREWDFSPASVDALEEVLRARFHSYEEVRAAQGEPEVTVPAWYLGEVQNRHFGTGWYASPVVPVDAADQDGSPFVLVPEKELEDWELLDKQERGETYEDEDYRPGSNPFVEIGALFVRGPDNRLRNVLDQYAS